MRLLDGSCYPANATNCKMRASFGIARFGHHRIDRQNVCNFDRSLSVQSSEASNEALASSEAL